MAALPAIDGWTTDHRVQESRLVTGYKDGKPNMDTARFDSAKDRRLRREMRCSVDARTAVNEDSPFSARRRGVSGG